MSGDERLARRADNSVAQVIEDTCKEHDLVYTRHEGAHGGLPGIIVELPGERRLKTNTILSIGEHSVRVEAFVCRKPDENNEGVYRFLLKRNRRLYGVAYTLDNVGDIYLVGRMALHSVTADEIDRVLGQVLEAVDADFNTLLELGFQSSIQKEWEWRVSRGESLKNLRAFEHLIDDDDDRRRRRDRLSAMGDSTLVLLRHGESEWNALNLFTGWVDVDLTDKGRAEAIRGGELIAEHGLLPDVLYTSVLRRAINTANLALDKADRHWIPVHRDWRLNERHYGALQGLDKAETKAKYGEEQFMKWRRSYDTPPPPIERGSKYSQDSDPRYADIDGGPLTECLADVVARFVPYFTETIVPDLQAGKTVLIAAHGNSLRALVKYLDQMSDEDVVALNIPTGIPLRYDLDGGSAPEGRRRHLPGPRGGRGGRGRGCQSGREVRP